MDTEILLTAIAALDEVHLEHQYKLINAEREKQRRKQQQGRG